MKIFAGTPQRLDPGARPTFARTIHQVGVSGYTPTNDAALESAFDGDTYNATQFTSYSLANSTGDGAYVFLRYAFGTPAAPLAVSSAFSTLGALSAAGYNGSAFTGSRASILLRTSQAWSVGHNGTQILIFTTPNDSGTNTLTATFGQDKSLTVVGNVIAPSAVLGPFTVATLPTGAAGKMTYASDLRVFDGAGVKEGAGVGTGGMVSHNGTAWKIVGTNSTASA